MPEPTAKDQRIRSWAEAMGAVVVDIIRDEGIGGGKLLAERPGGRRIAKAMDARRPEADVVVVVRMDRLGRDAAEQISLLKRFCSGGVASSPSPSRSTLPPRTGVRWPRSPPSSVSLSGR